MKTASSTVATDRTPAPHFRVLDRPQLKGSHFLVVGSLDDRRSWGVVLDALARTPKDERPRVVFVGFSLGFDLLEEARRRDVHESVEQRAGVSDEGLVRLYNDATALVCPSSCDRARLRLVEAFACGTPVISSSSASLREIAGRAAIYFEPVDASALAAAMRSLDETKRSDLRIQGFARLEYFRMTSTCASHSQLCPEVDS